MKCLNKECGYWDGTLEDQCKQPASGPYVRGCQDRNVRTERVDTEMNELNQVEDCEKN